MSKNINILILDDEPIVCDLLTSNLLKKGYTVEMDNPMLAKLDPNTDHRSQDERA